MNFCRRELGESAAEQYSTHFGCLSPAINAVLSLCTSGRVPNRTSPRPVARTEASSASGGKTRLAARVLASSMVSNPEVEQLESSGVAIAKQWRTSGGAI